MSGADRTLEAALATFAQRAYFERQIALYSKRYRLPPEDVADAINTAFLKILETYAGKPVGSPEALFHRAINNELLTLLRRSAVMRFVELDEDYGVIMSSKARIADDDSADEPERVLVWSDEERSKEAHDLASRRAARQPNVGRTPQEIAEHLENVLIESIDTQDLEKEVLKQLDARYGHVVVLLLQDWTPDELHEGLGGDGYRIRHWARVKVCRILGKLAAAGHDLAERLHAQGGCSRLLRSLKTGKPAIA
ncbi:MAG: sigma-70 family RNA polymerase sigma factor [Alphaproteobacteria bacterium]|nr:sigma-70 family RNA polymerase sigma factor [Alphaproteobacteria bacterium]